MTDVVEQEEPLRNMITIHIDLPEEATAEQADQFFEALASWVGLWMDNHPDRGGWDPFVHSHTKACEHSDHCYGPGSKGERDILARDHVKGRHLLWAAAEAYREAFPDDYDRWLAQRAAIYNVSPEAMRRFVEEGR